MSDNAKVHHVFDLVSGLTKELIKLSTGVITISLLFSDKVPSGAKKIAFWSWSSFVASTFFGVLALMAIAGAHERALKELKDPVLRENLKFFSATQILLFATGIVIAWMLGLKMLT